MANQALCTRGDLRVDALVTVDVNDDGTPICNAMAADAIEEKAYWCSNCDTTWDEWSEALSHLKAEA